jgi:hypothetical protein
MNPMDVLAPNYLGHSETNTGVDSLTANTGWGVAEASPRADVENAGTDKVKRAAARQFGKPMDEVF